MLSWSVSLRELYIGREPRGRWEWQLKERRDTFFTWSCSNYHLLSKWQEIDNMVLTIDHHDQNVLSTDFLVQTQWLCQIPSQPLTMIGTRDLKWENHEHFTPALFRRNNWEIYRDWGPRRNLKREFKLRLPRTPLSLFADRNEHEN